MVSIDQTFHSIISIMFILVYYPTIGFLLHPLFFSNKRFYKINLNEAIFQVNSKYIIHLFLEFILPYK